MQDKSKLFKLKLLSNICKMEEEWAQKTQSA